MNDVIPLDAVERAILRGLNARHRELRPLIDAHHADRKLLEALVAARLGVDVADLFAGREFSASGDSLERVAKPLKGSTSHGEAGDCVQD